MLLGRRRALCILAALCVLFAGRMALNCGATLRSVDEANFVVAGARLATDGGPLYRNALAPWGPVVCWLTALVFRVAGLYHMTALRLVLVAWWVGTGLLVYWAARALLGRLASLGAAAAFFLAAMNPGFQDIRVETLVPPFLAAAAGLVLRGVARRNTLLLALSGVAMAGAFLTRQQVGPMLALMAAFPLALAWHPRDGGRRWWAVAGPALVVAGFAALVGAVVAWYAARGLLHDFVYCFWTQNWAQIHHWKPSGRYLPSLGYLVQRGLYFLTAEPLVPLALTGAVAGVASPAADAAGSEDARSSMPWRLGVGFLGMFLLTALLVASPANERWVEPRVYVTYAAFLHVPAALLCGVCVALAARRGARPRLLAVAGAFALAYLALPAARSAAWEPFRLLGYAQRSGWPALLVTVAALAAAGWLLGGRRVAWLAPLAWVAAQASWRGALGAEFLHASAAVQMAAVGLAWRAGQRRSLILASAAGLLLVPALVFSWRPALGVALIAAAWILGHRRLGRLERLVLAAAVLAPSLLVAPAVVRALGTRAWEMGPWPEHAVAWAHAGGLWLRRAQPLVALALAGLLLERRRLGNAGSLWERPAALLGLIAVGSAALALVPGFPVRFATTTAAALTLAAALAVGDLLRPAARAGDRGAPLLLTGAVAATALAALALGLRTPSEFHPSDQTARVADAMGSGRRALVWGTPFDTELYVRARAVPAAPQVLTFMIEGVGAPVRGTGLRGYSRPATLDGLADQLCADPPEAIVLSDQAPSLAERRRVSLLLGQRYRLVGKIGQRRVFRLRDGMESALDSPAPPVQDPSRSGEPSRKGGIE